MSTGTSNVTVWLKDFKIVTKAPKAQYKHKHVGSTVPSMEFEDGEMCNNVTPKSPKKCKSVGFPPHCDLLQ